MQHFTASFDSKRHSIDYVSLSGNIIDDMAKRVETRFEMLSGMDDSGMFGWNDLNNQLEKQWQQGQDAKSKAITLHKTRLDMSLRSGPITIDNVVSEIRNQIGIDVNPSNVKLEDPITHAGLYGLEIYLPMAPPTLLRVRVTE